MSAKITLTGVPVGPVEVFPAYYRLTMEEAGTPNPPKGLPPASGSITFTVLVSKKQGAQLGLPDVSQRLLIQGELTLDLPLEDCPGEIGVIAFQAQVIADKKATPAKAAPVSVATDGRPWPDLSGYQQIALDSIKVPEEFLKTQPNKAKTQALQAQVAARGQLDEPVVIRPTSDGTGYVLYDGYRRYIVAQTLGWKTVPVEVRTMDTVVEITNSDQRATS